MRKILGATTSAAVMAGIIVASPTAAQAVEGNPGYDVVISVQADQANTQMGALIGLDLQNAKSSDGTNFGRMFNSERYMGQSFDPMSFHAPKDLNNVSLDLSFSEWRKMPSAPGGQKTNIYDMPARTFAFNTPTEVRWGAVGKATVTVQKLTPARKQVQLQTFLYNAHDPGEPGDLEVYGVKPKINNEPANNWLGSRDHWERNRGYTTLMMPASSTSVAFWDNFYEDDTHYDYHLGTMSVNVPLDNVERSYFAKDGPRDVTMWLKAQILNNPISVHRGMP